MYLGLSKPSEVMEPVQYDRLRELGSWNIVSVAENRAGDMNDAGAPRK